MAIRLIETILLCGVRSLRILNFSSHNCQQLILYNMSKRASSKTKRQGPAKDTESTKALDDPSNTEISDTIERRRMQNRLAQRNHRTFAVTFT
jgi:hypothetical protein